RALAATVLHLEATRAALRRAEQYARPREFVEHWLSGGQRHRVVGRVEAERAGHSRATHVNCMDAQLRDQRKQRRAGAGAPQRLEVTWDVVAAAPVERQKVSAQLALLVEIPQVSGQFDSLPGDEARVGVVEQIVDVVAPEEGGRRLGAEDRVAFAGQPGEE